jgi:hypothetical protein
MVQGILDRRPKVIHRLLDIHAKKCEKWVQWLRDIAEIPRVRQGRSIPLPAIEGFQSQHTEVFLTVPLPWLPSLFFANCLLEYTYDKYSDCGTPIALACAYPLSDCQLRLIRFRMGPMHRIKGVESRSQSNNSSSLVVTDSSQGVQSGKTDGF